MSRRLALRHGARPRYSSERKSQLQRRPCGEMLSGDPWRRNEAAPRLSLIDARPFCFCFFFNHKVLLVQLYAEQLKVSLRALLAARQLSLSTLMYEFFVGQFHFRSLTHLLSRKFPSMFTKVEKEAEGLAHGKARGRSRRTKKE